MAATAFARKASLDSIDVQTSPLSNARNILEAIFSFRDRSTDVVEKYFTRVDVTDEFPFFLVTKMSLYYRNHVNAYVEEFAPVASSLSK